MAPRSFPCFNCCLIRKNKSSKVVSENLSVERLTIFNNGNGGIPNLAQDLTGSVISFMEGIKGAPVWTLKSFCR